ncbi:MAG: site-2 protease family protein [Methanobacteriaceae archaeon]|nr:site-2 protease family protein [Methanobacteriaceae archaeon]
MNGIWYYAIAFVVIWVIAVVFKDYLERYGVEVTFPVLMWKTQRLRGFIDKIANLSKRFWKWFMNIGIVVSVIFMVIMAITLVYSLTMITTTPSVSLLLPGVDVPGSPIFIPFFYGFIALATVIIVHEFSHGILARVENISLKSIGLLLFAILPGAFVEPDDEEMEELSKPAKLRIYAAGSMGNLSLAAIALVLMMICSAFIVPACFHEDGIEIDRIVSGSPAEGYLKSGMIIKSINNHSVSDSESYVNAAASLKPNSTVDVVTDQGTISFKGSVNPNNKSIGYMGVQAQKHYSLNNGFDNQVYSPLMWILIQLPQLFMWIALLNFAVGTFNLLPMKPLDGGHIFETLLSYVCSDMILKAIVTFVSYLMAMIIIVSLVYGFMM